MKKFGSPSSTYIDSFLSFDRLDQQSVFAVKRSPLILLAIGYSIANEVGALACTMTELKNY